MFNFKRKTYTIKFNKTRKYDMSRIGILVGGYSTVCTGEIISRVTFFCLENNIELKKIHINEDMENGYIKIQGTQEDYNKLIAFLTLGILKKHIEVTNLKW